MILEQTLSLNFNTNHNCTFDKQTIPNVKTNFVVRNKFTNIRYNYFITKNKHGQTVNMLLHYSFVLLFEL